LRTLSLIFSPRSADRASIRAHRSGTGFAIFTADDTEFRQPEIGVSVMQFRWAAAIALWTMLSGPIFVHVQTMAHRARPAAQQTSRASLSQHR
jgi:hypothetical protein